MVASQGEVRVRPAAGKGVPGGHQLAVGLHDQRVGLIAVADKVSSHLPTAPEALIQGARPGVGWAGRGELPGEQPGGRKQPEHGAKHPWGPVGPRRPTRTRVNMEGAHTGLRSARPSGRAQRMAAPTWRAPRAGEANREQDTQPGGGRVPGDTGAPPANGPPSSPPY